MQFSLIKKYMFLCAAFLLCGQISFAQTQNALDIAQKHLQKNSAALNLTSADLADFKVSNNYVSAHNGVTHLYLIQKYEEIEVYNGMININILPSGKVLNLGNRFVSDLRSRVNTTAPQITAAQAVEKVITHLNVPTEIPYVLTETERINDREVIFQHAGIALEPIKTKLVFEVKAKQNVRLAWQVYLYETTAQNWWNARIDAVTGEVLSVDNHVVKCDFGQGKDMCHEDHKHAHSAQKTTIVDDVNNAYNVFPLYIESPIHGTQSLVVQPANSTASPFGWHDTDGMPGEEYTITRGNNAHAYQDIFDQNQSVGGEPDGGDSLLFDFPFDTETTSPYTQIDASTVNVFYWNNLIHDVFYQYGFDEVSGNFQANNYNNGGEGGDYVQAECLDGSGSNNANFGTPPDGSRPRMQMYFWGSGSAPLLPELSINVTAPEAVVGSYAMAVANFGGDLPDYSMPLVGDLVLVDDGTDVTSDACEDLINALELDGSIALIDRGNCNFGAKALAAQNVGSIAVIFCNDEEGDPFAAQPGATGNQVNIPVVMIDMQDCDALKAEAGSVVVNLSDRDYSIDAEDGPTGVDSGFDNGIIAHEYGHGISNRLTGGPNETGCLFNPEQMGEGWSDFAGLVLTTTPANNADEVRGIGTFADGQPTTGNGIRTYPYTRNMAVNPHTYADINNESVPHGVGSVWCATLWDLYWNLIDAYGHDANIYSGTGGNNRAIQLVTDGMKLQPCLPNFITGRDAIIAADEANYGGENFCLIWETFARRGLGIDAEEGGNENFDIPLRCTNAIQLNKVGELIAEGGQFISYSLEIGNGLPTDVADLTVTDVLPENTTYIEGSSNCPVTEDNGVLTFTVENAPSFVVTSCTYNVEINEGDYTNVKFFDDVENGLSLWETGGNMGSNAWTESNASPFEGTSSLYVPNTNSANNQFIVLAESVVLSDENPVLSFLHRYNTEKFYDGGVVELKLSISSTWFDLGGFMMTNGYDGLIVDEDDNILGGKRAFHGDSEGYVNTLVDLSLYSGLTVDIRFRFASDTGGSADGWYVDNVRIFDDPVTIENTACLTDNNGNEICTNAETIVYSSLTSTENITANDPRVTIFPNPTSNRFTLKVDTEASAEAVLKMYGIDGKLLFTQTFNTSDNLRTDMSKYGAGIYFAELITDELQIVKKVVVR